MSNAPTVAALARSVWHDFCRARRTLVLYDVAFKLVEAWLVAELAPADYSNLKLPGNRSEIRIGEAAFGASTTAIVLGQTPRAENASQCQSAFEALVAFSQSPGWSGRIALTVETTSGSALRFDASEVGATGPKLSTTETMQAQTDIAIARLFRFPDRYERESGILG